MSDFDAIVVGSGPNGLAAAVELTRADLRVLVLEAADSIGGGTRSSELTLPGFVHDVCSAIHPLGIASPFLRTLHGVKWIQPAVSVTHPLGDGRVGVLHRDFDTTVAGLGKDGNTYRRLIGPLVSRADVLIDRVLGPIGPDPRYAFDMARFGLIGGIPAAALAKLFTTPEARAILAGLAAHAIASLSRPLTGAVTELFATTAHSTGWPLVRGGSQQIAALMAGAIVAGGGKIETGRRVRSLEELPDAQLVMLDVMPPAAVEMAGTHIDPSTQRRLRSWRPGPGVFKLDWALNDPVPWRDEFSRKSGTVHVGGTFEEIAASERQVQQGDHPQRPFVLIAQQSLFDSSRAPNGHHTLWGYCHVPAGSTVDMTNAIEAQIERFAPGFRDCIVARHTMSSMSYEMYNANYVGGDIAGGSFTMRRVFQFGLSRPYRLGKGVYLCSSATPPGAGVHGMCGYHAARAALDEIHA